MPARRLRCHSNSPSTCRSVRFAYFGFRGGGHSLSRIVTLMPAVVKTGPISGPSGPGFPERSRRPPPSHETPKPASISSRSGWTCPVSNKTHRPHPAGSMACVSSFSKRLRVLPVWRLRGQVRDLVVTVPVDDGYGRLLQDQFADHAYAPALVPDAH